MSRAKTLGNRHRVGLCALAMALLAALVLLWCGLMPLTAVLIAIFVSCLGAALYAWWLSRRVLQPLDDVGCTSTEQNLHNNPKRTR